MTAYALSTGAFADRTRRVFTGLVEDVGTITAVERVPMGERLTVETHLEGLQHGDSLAIDGVCLTVVGLDAQRFAFDVSAETLARTTLGDLRTASRVNLERPMALGERLGGHLVLGHVDGVGEIVQREPVGQGVRFVARLPRELMPLVVFKGSVALDGISLTVNELIEQDQIALMIIPETLRATTWGEKGIGARINVEADILAKHVQRLMESSQWNLLKR